MIASAPSAAGKAPPHQLPHAARQRIARQIAETAGVVTTFGDAAAAPQGAR